MCVMMRVEQAERNLIIFIGIWLASFVISTPTPFLYPQKNDWRLLIRVWDGVDIIQPYFSAIWDS